jgi:uncharacterized protein (DUF169 family)
MYASVARGLERELNLEVAPIALARVDAPPSNVSRLSEKLPSACALWRRAETDVFYADAALHMGCPIGAMVLGFELPEAAQRELAVLVRTMCELDYVVEAEVAHIPKLEPPAARGIVYGPLARFPIEPELVLVWTTPAQAMLLQEAVGATMWTESPASTAFGRPACGALPVALRRGQSVLSLGCIGMRTFTDVAESRCLAALPRPALDGLEQKLEHAGEVNERMAAFYRSRKSAVSA